MKGYDYSMKGAYFITICAFENRHHFGRINSKGMISAQLGSLVEEWWDKIPDRFSGVTIGDFILMPNHIHGILILDSVRQGNQEIEEREASEGQERETDN